MPSEVTCPGCQPTAAKFARAQALQAFEEAEVEWRKADGKYREALRVKDEAGREVDAAQSALSERREVVKSLLDVADEVVVRS